MQGKIKGGKLALKFDTFYFEMTIPDTNVTIDTFYVMDSFGLPVEGTETRVNAGSEANEFMCQHIDASEKVNRPEHICGWYHSHPGYGCWLSGIDVSTQSLYQRT